MRDKNLDGEISVAFLVMLLKTLSGRQGHFSLHLRANAEDGGEEQTSKRHEHEKEGGISILMTAILALLDHPPLPPGPWKCSF